VPDTEKQRAEIIARAWEDPEYKAKLLSNPKEALADMGVTVPDGVDLKVLETTPEQTYFVLPAEPSGDLSNAELEMVAGGMGGYSTPTCTGCRSGGGIRSLGGTDGGRL
jgi:hypothetical protein